MCVCVCVFRYSLFVYLFHIYFNLVTVYYGQISNKRYILRHLLKGSVYHSPTMGHPNKRAVRKLSYYESSHENMSSLFVHVIPHSCNSAVLKLFDTWSYQSLVILFFSSVVTLIWNESNGACLAYHQNPALGGTCFKVGQIVEFQFSLFG